MKLSSNKRDIWGEDVRLVDRHDTKIGNDRLTSQIGSEGNSWMCCDGNEYCGKNEPTGGADIILDNYKTGECPCTLTKKE